MECKKILLALAGKPEEQIVIREAFQLAEIFKAELTVIHVNDEGAGKVHMMMDSPPYHGEKEVLEWIKAAGVEFEPEKIEIQIARNNNYSEEIAQATGEMDLLVIGHRYKNSFLAMISDSVDEHVADKVTCPLLVVPMR